MERHAGIEEGFSQNSPLVYHYGHKTPGHNLVLFNQLVSKIGNQDVNLVVQKTNPELVANILVLLTLKVSRFEYR